MNLTDGRSSPDRRWWGWWRSSSRCSRTSPYGRSRHRHSENDMNRTGFTEFSPEFLTHMSRLFWFRWSNGQLLLLLPWWCVRVHRSRRLRWTRCQLWSSPHNQRSCLLLRFQYWSQSDTVSCASNRGTCGEMEVWRGNSQLVTWYHGQVHMRWLLDEHPRSCPLWRHNRRLWEKKSRKHEQIIWHD